MKRIISLCLLLFLAGQVAFAQKHVLEDRSKFYIYGNQFFVDAVEVPYANKDSIKIAIMFKVSNSILHFKKNSDLREKVKVMYAVPELEAKFKNSMGIIKKNVRKVDTIWVDSYEKTQDKNLYYNYSDYAILPKDEYKINVVLGEEDNPSIREESLQKIIGKSFYETETMSEPIFVHRFDAESSSNVAPFNIGSNIPFTADGAQAYFSISYSNPEEVIEYSLKYMGHIRQKGLHWTEPFEKSGKAEIIPNRILDFTSDDSGNIVFDLKDFNSEQDLKIGLLKIDLRDSDIFPGRYEFELKRKSTGDEYSYTFDVIWMDKPYSLYTPYYALKMMYYILEDEEYEQFNDGDDDYISRKIIEYWKHKDPTPETPYNEAMAEYFRRVDFAFFNLKDINEKDGAKTKRGMIYILHGEPDAVEDTIKDKVTTLKWRYNKLGQEFVFTSNDGSEYKLIKINDI
jgi:GWxTD domain-containing protein